VCFFIIYLAWLKGNSIVIYLTQSTIQELSVKLKQQNVQIKNLTRTLAEFSNNLKQLLVNVGNITFNRDIRNQTIEHILCEN